MAKGQYPKGSFPGWRTMTSAERYNARMFAMFERARQQGHTGLYSGPARDTVAQAARVEAPGYDPTCVFCASGEEPGHEH